jgi:cytidylate kinase
MIITVDGPAGSGKSTAARLVAEKRGFIFLETGAMYRAITLKIIREGTALDDSQALTALLKAFEFKIETHERAKRYFLDGEDVTEQLRSPEVTQQVSAVSAILSVRKALVEIQRQCAQGIDAVVEGRDMGTVVFPDAEFKFYLIASPEVRAQRRYKEIIAKDPAMKDKVSIEDIISDIKRRDHIDSSREHSPLRPADDAYTIDSSSMSIDEVIDSILKRTVS